MTDYSLYLVTDTGLCGARGVAWTVEEAIAGVKAHTRNIEGITVNEFRWVSFHQIENTIYCIRHVHHIHIGAFADKGCIVTFCKRIVVNMHSIVSCSTTG